MGERESQKLQDPTTPYFHLFTWGQGSKKKKYFSFFSCILLTSSPGCKVFQSNPKDPSGQQPVQGSSLHGLLESHKLPLQSPKHKMRTSGLPKVGAQRQGLASNTAPAPSSPTREDVQCAAESAFCLSKPLSIISKVTFWAHITGLHR